MVLDSKSVLNYLCVLEQFEDLLSSIIGVNDIGKVKFWHLNDDPVFKIQEIDDQRQELWRSYLEKGVKMSDLRNSEELTGFVAPRGDELEVIKGAFQ